MLGGNILKIYMGRIVICQRVEYKRTLEMLATNKNNEKKLYML